MTLNVSRNLDRDGSVGRHAITLAVQDDHGASGPDQVAAEVQPETDPVIPQGSLVMCLKADAIPDVVDHDPVVNWPGAPPNRLISTQAEPARRPLWIRNTIEGQPAIRFDGVDDALMVDCCRGLLYSYNTRRCLPLSTP